MLRQNDFQGVIIVPGASGMSASCLRGDPGASLGWDNIPGKVNNFTEKGVIDHEATIVGESIVWGHRSRPPGLGLGPSRRGAGQM